MVEVRGELGEAHVVDGATGTAPAGHVTLWQQVIKHCAKIDALASGGEIGEGEFGCFKKEALSVLFLRTHITRAPTQKRATVSGGGEGEHMKMPVG